MHDEEACKFLRVDGVVGGNEDALFGKSINDDENGSKAERRGKLLDEVHRYRMPGASGNRELLQRAIGFVARSLRTTTTSTGTNELDYI